MKSLLFVLLAVAVSARAELPAAQPSPTRPVNVDPKGPPIPAAAPVESAHPASIPLWAKGAPGSEARKDEPESISWRQEPDIVFPVISNIHNPSLTPYLPAKDKATGCAVIIAPGGGHMQHTIDREGYDLGKWFAEISLFHWIHSTFSGFGDQAALWPSVGSLPPTRTSRQRPCISLMRTLNDSGVPASRELSPLTMLS